MLCAHRSQDAKKSLDFYTRVMGMTLFLKLEFPDSKFSLFFLGYHPEADIPEDPAERVRLAASWLSRWLTSNFEAG